jgi:hypothetical protein
VNVTDWFLSLPPAEALVPCGAGTHAVRWEADRLVLPAHPDAEAELVLAALGGDRPRCVEVAETWDRRADDLDVLLTGPRSLADEVTIDWDEPEERRLSWLGMSPRLAPSIGYSGAGRAGPGRLRPTKGPQGGIRLPEELERRLQARIEVLQLLALGPAFQFRLAGAVTSAWSADCRAEDRVRRRPELAAALTGRLAPAAAEWLGIDPDAVTATPLDPPRQQVRPDEPVRSAAPSAWGTLAVTGTGAGRLLRASLPVGWLASVWACGLAVVDGHLVVAVEQAGWPRARVLALPEPGAPPVLLDVEAAGDSPLPHWAIASRI